MKLLSKRGIVPKCDAIANEFGYFVRLRAGAVAYALEPGEASELAVELAAAAEAARAFDRGETVVHSARSVERDS